MGKALMSTMSCINTHTNFKSDIASRWIWQQTQERTCFSEPWVSELQTCSSPHSFASTYLAADVLLFCYVSGKEACKQEAKSKLAGSFDTVPCTWVFRANKQPGHEATEWEEPTNTQRWSFLLLLLQKGEPKAPSRKIDCPASNHLRLSFSDKVWSLCPFLSGHLIVYVFVVNAMASSLGL